MNTVSNSNAFLPFPFQIALPDDDPDQPPQAMITIDVVDQAVADAICSITSSPTITIDVVAAAAHSRPGINDRPKLPPVDRLKLPPPG